MTDDINSKLCAAYSSDDDFLLAKLLMSNPAVAKDIIERFIAYDEVCGVHLQNLMMKGVLGTASDTLSSHFMKVYGRDSKNCAIWTYVTVEAAKRLHAKSSGSTHEFVCKCIDAAAIEISVFLKIRDNRILIGDRALDCLRDRGGMLGRFMHFDKLMNSIA